MALQGSESDGSDPDVSGGDVAVGSTEIHLKGPSCHRTRASKVSLGGVRLRSEAGQKTRDDDDDDDDMYVGGGQHREPKAEGVSEPFDGNASY